MRSVAWIAIACLSATSAGATSIKSVKLDDLYREADLVALVRIVASDVEAPSDAMYRAEVVEAFKTAKTGTKMYFGPYIGYELGSDYVLFAKRSDETASVAPGGVTGRWADESAQLFHVMYGGYSMLPTKYTCVFDGCGDGVHVPSTQVLMPEGIRVVEHKCEPGSNYDSWVRKAEFLAYLRTMAEPAQRRSEELPNNEMQRTRPAQATAPRR